MDPEFAGTVPRERVAAVIREIMAEQAERAARRNGAKSGDAAGAKISRARH